MALILCLNPITKEIGWRNENSTVGYEKLLRLEGVKWKLNQDPGEYLFKDGNNIGWRYKTFNVTVIWNANGGSTTATTITIPYGTTIVPLPSASRSGYGFTGWFTASVGGTKITELTIIISDMTVYAQWASPPTNIVITRNPNTNTITKGTSVTITGSATDPLYPADSLVYTWEGRIAQTSNAYPIGVNVVVLTVTNPAGASAIATTSFYVYDPGVPGATSGGWNGGGSYGPTGTSGGGGGATDIRLGGNTLNHRIIVAGGGGGAGNGNTLVTSNNGAVGGGLTAARGTATTSATQAAAGTSPNGNGTFGVGGSHNADGGGGGGGWYGGGAATGDYGAGGGSSYVAASLTNTSVQAGINADHGRVQITNPLGAVTAFVRTNTVQVYMCTMDGNYKLECWGGKGGDDALNGVAPNIFGRGGNGGYTSGYVQLKTNDILFVYVGGMGGSNSTVIN